MDFATGVVAVTKQGAPTQLTTAGNLDSAAQQRFWQLAAVVVANPDFSMELGVGHPPYIPGRNYPLSLSELGLPTATPKSGGDDDNERSPCNGGEGRNQCREVNVSTFRPGLGSLRIIGGGGRIGGVGGIPPLPSPIRPVCAPDVPPAVCNELWRTNQAEWERWREGRCNDAALNGAFTVGAGAATFGTCVTPAVVAIVPCAGSALVYLASGIATALAARDCASTYRGPGTWP